MGRNMNRSSDVFLFRKFSMRKKYLHCWLTSFVNSLLRTFSVRSKTCSHHPGPLHFISINIGLEKLGSKWSGQINKKRRYIRKMRCYTILSVAFTRGTKINIDCTSVVLLHPFLFKDIKLYIMPIEYFSYFQWI